MFILASKSQRRIDLLKSLDLEFKVEVASIDEHQILLKHENASYQKQVEAIAFAKAQAVYGRHHGKQKVLAGDTIVVIDYEILGKPKDKTQAKEMLMKLCGRTHEVYTAIVMLDDREPVSFVSTSLVTFRPFDQEVEAIIDASIDNGSALDKAGAYGIQETGRLLVSHIDGDFYGIMGLPISKVYELLIKKEWI